MSPRTMEKPHLGSPRFLWRWGFRIGLKTGELAKSLHKEQLNLQMPSHTPCTHFGRMREVYSLNQLNCRGYHLRDTGHSWGQDDVWSWKQEDKVKVSTNAEWHHPCSWLLSLPTLQMVTLSLTITPGTFWQENGDILTADIDCPKQEKKKSVNTDVWKFTQRASQVPTWSYYNKAYQSATSTRAHKAIKGLVLKYGYTAKGHPIFKKSL